MATWQEINQDIGKRGFDLVRREKLKQLAVISGRPTIVYAVEISNTKKISAVGVQSISVDISDMTGFTEVLRDISDDNLDIVLQSPGGAAEAAESIVRLVRSRFKSVRFIVPLVAKSAATILAMSGDEIILGTNGELGPTDPQMIMSNGRVSPAHAILQQFKEARDELKKNRENLQAWLPILEQLGPSLIAQCNDAISLSETLVKKWLKDYMLKDLGSKSKKPSAIAKYLASNHLSHSRAITAEDLRARGVKIKRAAAISAEFSDALDDLHTAHQLTFERTGVFKIFESHSGQSLIQQIA